MFFVRNLYIWLICLALLFGGVFLFISGTIYYSNLKSNTISVYKNRLIELSPILFSFAKEKSSGQDSFFQSFIKKNVNAKELYFTRVVNTNTGRIIASTNSGEAGGFYEEWANFEEEGVIKQTKEIEAGQEKITSLTYKTDSGLSLWFALDEQHFEQSLLIFLVKQGALVLGMTILLFFLFYFLEKKYLLKPMRELRDTVKDLGEDKFVYSEKDMPKSLGGLLASFNDIAEDVESVLKHEKKSAEIKKEFISTTAHQLRTPLSGINWALESLKMDPKKTLNSSQKKLVERAHKKSQELIKMVKSLLMTSSLEKGKLGFHYENFDIVELVEDILEEEKKQASEAEVKLSSKFSSEESISVKADKERIRWVVRNIIENAIRYTPQEGKVSIDIKEKKDNRKYVLVSVADNGMGISEEDQEHIFEKFYRSKRAIQKHNEGNGLGLFIVKKIVEHHKGEIWFETEKGEGTTFYFTLPI